MNQKPKLDVAETAGLALASEGQAFAAILWRDLLATFRHRSEWLNPLFFLLMVVSLFPLGISPDPQTLTLIAPGVLWIAALLSTLLAVDALFLQDYEDGSLEQLLLSPHSLYLMVLAKLLAHWLATGLPVALLAPLLGIMLNLSGEGLWVLTLSLLLGTPTLTLITAIGAALTVAIRRGGLLVSLIALPLYIPVLILGSSAVVAAVNGFPSVAQLSLLAALLALALVLAPLAVAASLRVSLSA
ncbi:MAG TPA: heme exporter protein CcmB [Pseudomonadales bacterium]|nr:heme exporter protein CcmB [Pseudomonadales bacterium]